jgi:hypothetical protein
LLIARYTEEHVPFVRAFNERLRAGGSPFQFGAEPSQNAFRSAANEVRPEHFLLFDEGGAVRGAYTLVFQRFLIGGVPEAVAFLQIPISEGSVSSAFGAVGLLLLKDALRRSPLLFGLGMGGIERPLPKLFRVLGARVCEVPFLFQVVRPRAFLANASALQGKRYLRVTSRVAAVTGIGSLAFRIMNGTRRRHAMSRRNLRVERTTDFGAAADEVWESATAKYSCISIRDRETLNYLYPVRDPRYHRLVVYEERELKGWALVTDSRMQDHNHFGDMRVGAIANCLAYPGSEDTVICAASHYLRDCGVDLIVSNQLSPGWRSSLVREGYLNYRSNFVFATSPELTRKIKQHDSAFERVHINRGDGDGAYNL